MKRGSALFLAFILLLTAPCACARTSTDHLAAAESFLADGRYDEAITEFYEHLIDNPDEPRAYTGAAEAYLAKGNTAKAIEQYELMIRALPENAGGYLGLGELLKSTGKNKEAQEVFESLIALFPDRADGYLFLGALYKDTGDEEKAVRIFLELISRVPSCPDGYIEVGLYHFRNFRYYAAVAILSDGVRATGDKTVRDTYAFAAGYIVIDWHDPVVENVIRGYLDKPADAVTLSDLIEISTVEINGLRALHYGVDNPRLGMVEINGEPQDPLDGQITTLADFSNFIELTQLHIKSMPIDDLTPVGTLQNLRFLSVCDTNVRDVKPLYTLTRLSELRMDDNRIISISPLAELTRLTLLSLSDNYVEDISPIAGLSSLNVLILSNNNITDIEPLLEHRGFELLDLSGNRLRDENQISLISAEELRY